MAGSILSITPGYNTTYPSDVYVHMKIKSTYSVYDINGVAEYYKLISGSGAIVSCEENGYRNLTITPSVYGGFENPDGTTGMTANTIKYPKTVASPTLGTFYDKTTGNTNYYSHEGLAAVKVEVSIEWRHGTTWGNYSTFTQNVCVYSPN